MRENSEWFGRTRNTAASVAGQDSTTTRCFGFWKPTNQRKRNPNETTTRTDRHDVSSGNASHTPNHNIITGSPGAATHMGKGNVCSMLSTPAGLGATIVAHLPGIGADSASSQHSASDRRQEGESSCPRVGVFLNVDGEIPKADIELQVGPPRLEVTFFEDALTQESELIGHGDGIRLATLGAMDVTQNTRNEGNMFFEAGVEEQREPPDEVSSNDIINNFDKLNFSESAPKDKGQECELSGQTVGIGSMGSSALGSPPSPRRQALISQHNQEIALMRKQFEDEWAENALIVTELKEKLQHVEDELKKKVQHVQHVEDELKEKVQHVQHVEDEKAVIKQKFDEQVAKSDYTRWAGIQDFMLRPFPEDLESFTDLTSRVCSKSSPFFAQFLPPNVLGAVPCDRICRGDHGGDHEDVVNATAGQLAHMLPVSYECARHWVPAFAVLFQYYRNNARLAAKLFLFGWLVPHGIGQRRADHSGVVHNDMNLVKVTNQQLTVDLIPRKIMILKPSGAATSEEWLKEVITSAGKPSSFFFFALDRKTWIELGFSYHSINDRVREVMGNDTSVQSAIGYFNAIMAKVCKHFGRHPLDINEEEIHEGAEGDKLRLCKLIRAFFNNADFSRFPGLDAASITDKMVLCVDYAEASIKYPNPSTTSNTGLPESSNASNPWAYPVFLRSINGALTYIHRSRAWREWEEFFLNYCSRSNRMDLFNSRDKSALVLFPSCRDFKDSEKYCLLCKAYSIAYGSVFREIPDKINKLAVAFLHGASLSDEDLDLLVAFGEDQFSDAASASSEVDAELL